MATSRDDLDAAGAALRAATTAAPHGSLRVSGKARSCFPSWLCPKRERRSGEEGLLLMGRDGSGAEAETVEAGWARLRALRKKTAQLWRERQCFFITMGLSETGFVIGLGFLTGELSREMFRYEFLESCEATSRAMLAGAPLTGHFSSCTDALRITEGPWSLRSATEVSNVAAGFSGFFGGGFLLVFQGLFLLGLRDHIEGFKIPSACMVGSLLSLGMWYITVGGLGADYSIEKGRNDGEIYACLNATTSNAATFNLLGYCGILGSPKLPTSQAVGWLLGGGTLMIAVATLLVACLYRGKLATGYSAMAAETESSALYRGLRRAERVGAGGGTAAARSTHSYNAI